MATKLGGWYLNGSTLQYRLLNGETLTSTVLASITGLTGLKMEGRVVKVNRGGGKWSEINKDENGDALANPDITVTATEAVAANPEANPPVAAVPETATFKISDALLGTSKISVSGSTNYTAYLDLVNDKSKVHIDGTEVINYDKTGGKATIVGDLTAGFTLNNLNGNATSASYSNAAVNQTLATVSGLAKNYTASTVNGEASTVAFTETTKDTNGKVTKAGEIKLSKVTDVTGADATTVSALGTGAISVSMSNVATNNGINYYLKLGEKEAGDYEQKASTDEAAYWTVNGTKATYQYYSPTGYQVTNASGNVITNGDTAATKIKVTAAKTTTVLTVEGLANDITTNVTDTKIADAKTSVTNTRTKSIATEVGIGQARLGENTSVANSFVSGITVTTNVSSAETGNNNGKAAINITRSVLPTKGTVTVKAGKGFTVTTTTTTTANTNDFYTDGDAAKTNGNVVKQQRIWVINGNTAIYKEVDLAYYTVGKDKSGNDIITCTSQTNGTVLATIKNLNVDWLANEANLTRNTKDTNGVITAIKGITFTKDATYTHDDKGVPKVTSDSVVGEITLSKEVLSDKNVTINKSDNFKLALLAADDSDAGTTKAELPAFSNYKWNLNTNGTIATLKGTIGAGYMAADDGKTITYVAGGDNQTLATVNGLKKGTQLERDTTAESPNEGDTNYRRIGNYIGDPSVSDNFVDGLKINTSGTLSHGTTVGSKTLNRLTLTLSEHVMDTSKISLNSNYYTLAVDKTDKGNTIDNDITKKANSRTYVLEKTELYDQVSETDSSGKPKIVDKPKTGAEAIVGWHGSLGSTAILKQTVPACYELVKNNTETAVTSINYIKPGTATTLATVKGLNKDITENDISFDTTDHVITILNSNALTTSNVTIENPKGATVTYKLAISNAGNTGISEANLSTPTWSQLANGTVNFTSNVTSAGYKLNADANTITYTKEATTTATTLATITGLRKDLTQITDSSDSNVGQYVGVKFNKNDGTITLSKSALNNANVKLSGVGNYKLVINKTDDGKDITGPKMTVDSQEKDYSSVYIPTEVKTQTNVWSISGSTATLQDMKSDYYKYDETANSLTYVKAEVDKYTEDEATAAGTPSLKGKNKVHGQIKGLASGLFTSADGKSIGYYNDSGVFINAVTIDETNNKIKIVDTKALGTSTISLDGDLKTNYTIALSTTLADNQKPALVPGTDPEWTINRGTATYKGNIGAGFSNSSDGKSIVYSKAQNNATIATITGLNTTLTTASLEALMASTDDGSTPGTGLQFGTGDDANVITVYNDVLGNSDVKLTTNVAVLGKDYKLKLATESDSTEQAVKSTYEATETTQVWSIDKTTATYGTKTPTYYTLNNGQNEASDTITYHGEGVTDENKILTISGLASGLVTIKDDLIRGISVGTTSGTTFTADSDQTKATGTVFQLSSNVLPEKVGSEIVLTKLHDTDSKSYTLFLDASDTSIPTPSEGRIYSIAKSGSATVTITDKRTAGYEYGTKTEGSSTTKDQTKIVYSEEKQTGNKLIGTITGLSTTIEKKADGTIDGITVTDPSGIISSSNPGTIALDKKVLRNGNVELTSENYVLTDATGVAATSSEATWTKSGNAYELHIGKTAVTYTLDATKKKLTYGGGGDAGSVVAKIIGLKNTDDISVNTTSKTITIGTGSLNAQEVKFDSTSGYKFALNNVSASASTNKWELNNGTATFTQAVTAGYAVDSDNANNKIIYTPASSIVTTFNNLSKEITSITTENDGGTLVSGTKTETDNSADPATTTEVKTGIKFVAAANNKGTFTFTDENLLAHKQVKLTTKATGKDADGNNVSGDYTIVLDNDIAAKTAPPVWNKATNATTATLTETTAAGYSLATDSKSINYSSDPTTVTLATVSGLNKESVVGTTTIDSTETPAIGILDGTTFTAGLVVTTPQSGNNTGVIKIGNNVLNKTAVKLGTNDKYEFVLGTDSGNVVPDKNSASEKNIWTANGTTYTYKPVTPLYYAFASKKVNNVDTEDKKTINYIAQADVKENNAVKTLTTIKGLKSGLTIKDDGSIDGLDTTTTSRVTLSAKVLGTSDITSDKLNIQLASSDEDLVLASQTTKWKDQTEWVGNGNTYNLKKYDKAYYEEVDGENKIKYTKETTGTTYATITNLASDLKDSDIAFTQSDDDDKSKGGVIKISKAQLIEKDVTVKASNGGGVFTLELADDVTKSEISGETWSKSNATTAVLKGKQSQGYTLSEDAKAITYQKDNGKEITLATVSGLKSGATIADTDVTKVMEPTSTGTQSGGDVATAVNGDDGSTNTNQVDTGKRIITLNKTQLGTANVTVKGDGYTLAVAEDAKSKTEDAAWVKADNATKATFTQKTYNGFTESADGKTLTYVKATSNIDLATINGLSKDLKQSQMAVIDNSTAASEYADALVVLNTETKVITVKKAALSGKVTLGNKDDYTFALDEAEDKGSGTEADGKFGGDSVDAQLTFNNGTLSIVKGTTDAWELSADAKTINWTKADYATLATVTNLPKTLTYTPGANNPLEAVTVSGDTITVDDAAVAGLSNNGKITLSNKKVGDSLSGYTFAFASNSDLEDHTVESAYTSAPQKRWALSGTNLSLKEYTPAYYLPASTVTADKHEETITYIAEKTGSELAKIAGLPTGLYQDTVNPDNPLICLADGQTSAIAADMNDAGNKTITIMSGLTENTDLATKDLTFTLTSNKGYTFSSAGAIDSAEEPTPKPVAFDQTKSFTATASKGEVALLENTSHGWSLESDTKITHKKEVDKTVATIKGINKEFNYNDSQSDLSVNTDNNIITVGKEALTESNVTLTIPNGGELYNLTLGADVNSSVNASTTSAWESITGWAVSGGTATYKTYNDGNYYVKADSNTSKPNSIVYVKPTSGTPYATITGLNKTIKGGVSHAPDDNSDNIITLGKTELEGTSKVTLAIKTASSVNATVQSADEINKKIETGNTTAARFKLALSDDSADSVTASTIEHAVWDTNGTVANLTGTITKGYRLSNDQKTITYQAADSKLQVIAKVSNIKAGSQILDSDVTDSGDNNYLPNLKKITLKNEHLGTSNVMLTGEGYKLALDDDVIEASETTQWQNQTEWVNNNGTFTYKTYDKIHYALDSDGKRVTYTAAKDDKTNPNHQTYAQISGLSKTALSTAIDGATSVSGSANVTANDGVISLTADLFTEANVKLTDSQNGGYTLAFGDDVASIKSSVSNFQAAVSGTSATWTGTIGKGYFLANDGQNITYYNAAKTKQSLAKITGLNATISSNNNDAFSGKYNANTNTVSLAATDLSEKVVINSGIVAFDISSDYTGGNVTGSNAADRISLTGGSNSINAGGGNDYVQLDGGSNTFFYASGNGNDVIVGFTNNDTLKVTNVVGTTVNSKKVKDESTGAEKEVKIYKNNIEVYQDDKIADDAIVKVNNNYIRLKGVQAGNVTVQDKDNNEWNADYTHTSDGNDITNGSFIQEGTANVLADDNYAMTPNLSSIVKNSTASYAADDLVADDATSLTKQSTAVSYSDKK